MRLLGFTISLALLAATIAATPTYGSSTLSRRHGGREPPPDDEPIELPKERKPAQKPEERIDDSASKRVKPEPPDTVDNLYRLPCEFRWRTDPNAWASARAFGLSKKAWIEKCIRDWMMQDQQQRFTSTEQAKPDDKKGEDYGNQAHAFQLPAVPASVRGGLWNAMKLFSRVKAPPPSLRTMVYAP